MTTIYLNWKGPSGRETVDAFTKGENAPIGPEFGRYVHKMALEYRAAGVNVYKSSRACANWKE